MTERVPPYLGGLRTVPTFRGTPSTPAGDVHGVGPLGAARSVAVVGVPHWTLLLFLSTDCDGCADLWGSLAAPNTRLAPEGDAVVVVTRGPRHQDAVVLRETAPASCQPVMSDEAWTAYRVHGAPFFALVDGPGRRVVTEGVAWGADQVAGHVLAAHGGGGGSDAPAPVPRRSGA